MKKRNLFSVVTVTVFVLFCFMALNIAFAGTTAVKAPAIEETVLGWVLNNARVVNTGTVSNSYVGTLTTNYTVEADATAVGAATRIRTGTFRAVFSVFSPKSDMPGQKAGHWYLQGSWSITDMKATAQDKKARHSPSIIKGQVNAELPFNPLTDKGNMQAQLQLPYSFSGRDGIMGQGTFSGNEKFVGMIDINADIWPDVIEVLEVTK